MVKLNLYERALVIQLNHYISTHFPYKENITCKTDRKFNSYEWLPDKCIKKAGGYLASVKFAIYSSNTRHQSISKLCAQLLAIDDKVKAPPEKYDIPLEDLIAKNLLSKTLVFENFLIDSFFPIAKMVYLPDNGPIIIPSPSSQKLQFQMDECYRAAEIMMKTYFGVSDTRKLFYTMQKYNLTCRQNT